MYQPIILLVNSSVTRAHSMPVPRSASSARVQSKRGSPWRYVVKRHVLLKECFETVGWFRNKVGDVDEAKALNAQELAHDRKPQAVRSRIRIRKVVGIADTGSFSADLQHPIHDVIDRDEVQGRFLANLKSQFA